ncbi:MAG: tRNA (adenine57-N1/adenine58-N1)-methyltransferase [Acidimicrobiales bacterium]|jgi:tRNA (adenine57-N1/adenine58-N1)-methyltransferase catalytic subunit
MIRIGPLTEGDLVLLVDNKARRYLVTLSPEGEFHSHAGVLPHAELIGRDEGTEVSTTKGQKFRPFRPTLEEFILAMPRGAQVIYPKDIAPILMQADIAPGMRVFETGVGSGALSMALLRAGADVTGYELREDFSNRAHNNIEKFLGADVLDRYNVQLRDAYDGIDETEFDRAVLDLPEPWQVVPHAATALKPGGILVGYTPSITQAARLREALEHSGFTHASTMEVLHRGWHIEGQAVRPDHRMVAHTAFLTRARLLAD